MEVGVGYLGLGSTTVRLGFSLVKVFFVSLDFSMTGSFATAIANMQDHSCAREEGSGRVVEQSSRSTKRKRAC